MSSKTCKSLFVLATLAAPVLGGIGCTREVSHTESDKPGWFGGNKHEESTTYQHPDGSMSTEKTKMSTN